MSFSLSQLDAMTLNSAHDLSFNDRNNLLDLIIADSLRNVGEQPARQVGLMSDYFEENFLRLLKVKAIKISCGGFIPVDATGEVPTLVPEEQFHLVFQNMGKALERIGSKSTRIVNMVVFLKNMDYWSSMNSIYKQYVPSCPTRAAIGIQTLNKTYQIELTNVIAYKVSN